MSKRFRWTRWTYRKACSLERLISGRTELPDQLPELVRRLWALHERHPQHDDPLAGERWERMQYIRRKHDKNDDDGMPF